MCLFIAIILLVTCAELFMTSETLFVEKIYKQQLRGLYEEELSKILQEEIASTINSIQYKIIERAKTGINEYKFSIMCKKRHEPRICDNYDGHKEWLQKNPLSILSISKTYITREEITTSIIYGLKDIFPDVNITKSHKNCCDSFIIKW